jgi:hypothetical protein
LLSRRAPPRRSSWRRSRRRGYRYGAEPALAVRAVSGGDGSIPESEAPAISDESHEPVIETGKGGKSAPKKSVEMKRIEQAMIESLGTKVSLTGTNERGKIEIAYFSMEDLERLATLLGATPEE